MKNVNILVPPKKHIQIILDLNTLFMGIRVFMYKNIQATISQRKWIKSRLIICLLLFSNYTFASLIINTPIGKELRPDNNFISMGEAKLVNSKESSTSKPNNHYTLPFTLLHNLIMIKAIVDGKEGLLLLDTGMDELILNQNHFKGTTTNDYISGVINDKGDYQRKLVPVQIGNLPEHMQYAFISNLDQLEQSLQMDILGIYGVDFLKQFQWIIHYPQRYITFHPLSKSGHPIIEPSLPPPGKVLTLKNEGTHLSVQAKVGQSTMILVLDTGTSSLILDKKHKSYLSSNDNHLEDISYEAYAIGINGPKESISTFVINGLCVGNTQLPAMQVSFFSLKKINHGRYWKFDGILNPLFLCHGTIGINWIKKQLYIWTPIPNPLKDITESDKSLADMN